MSDRVDYTKVSPELMQKIEGWQANRPDVKTANALADLADMVQELIHITDEATKASQTDLKALGAVFTDAREQLVKLNAKEAPEAPESPDVATPIVTAIKRLEDAIAKVDVKPEFKPTFTPEITVSAPEVTIPKLDLSGIAALLKSDIPKAFNEAIAKIPKTEIPEAEDRWDEVIEWLKSIDTASRLKPQPGVMKVTGTDGGAVPVTGTITAEASTLADFSVNDIEEDTTSYFGYTKPDGTWLVKSLTATSVGYATVSNNGTVTTYTDAWTDKAILTYGRFDQAF